MIHFRKKILIIAVSLFCLSVQAQGTNEGSVTVKVNESATIALGSTYSRVLQYNATGINYRWYSSDASIASVGYSSYKSCSVKGKADGTCKVYFSASFFIDGFFRTYDFYWDVTVSGYTGGGGTTIVSPSSAVVYPSEVTLEVGQTCDLSYEVYPANATYTAEWVSYKKNVATVSPQGHVTAVGPGNALIYLWVYDNKGNSVVVETCDVTCIEPQLPSISDVVEVAKCIMNKQSDGYNVNTADMNGDGIINIADIIVLVNLLWGK